MVCLLPLWYPCCCGTLAAAVVCLLSQVPCKGRGESPDPLAVNMAVWEIRKTLSEQPNLFILVHCTHGFNRSGGDVWARPCIPTRRSLSHEDDVRTQTGCCGAGGSTHMCPYLTQTVVRSGRVMPSKVCVAAKAPCMALLTEHTQGCMCKLTIMMQRCDALAAAGFVIVSACMRLLAERGWCVERLLRRFSQQVRLCSHGFKAQQAPCACDTLCLAALLSAAP